MFKLPTTFPQNLYNQVYSLYNSKFIGLLSIRFPYGESQTIDCDHIGHDKDYLVPVSIVSGMG